MCIFQINAFGNCLILFFIISFIHNIFFFFLFSITLNENCVLVSIINKIEQNNKNLNNNLILHVKLFFIIHS